MPLDNVGTIILDDDQVIIDPLAAMGLIPVAKEFVTAYKKSYRVAWYADHGKLRVCTWRVVTKPNEVTLKQFLSYPMVYIRGSELAPAPAPSDSSKAPKTLIDLAREVEVHIPEAKFLVEYFDTDPILWVKYGKVKACLGIWDQGKMKAKASRIF